MTVEPIGLMIDRTPIDGDTEAELLLVHVDEDGGCSLLLDDGEVLGLDEIAATRLAMAILSPLAHRKVA